MVCSIYKIHPAINPYINLLPQKEQHRVDCSKTSAFKRVNPSESPSTSPLLDEDSVDEKTRYDGNTNGQTDKHENSSDCGMTKNEDVDLNVDDGFHSPTQTVDRKRTHELCTSSDEEIDGRGI